jgi:putative ABC transport system ATP-binding protein
LLELRELVKHYPAPEGEPVRAVDGVSLSLQAGEMVALYGPSGSGKTTLLMLIAGLLEPDSGAILFAGRELSALSSAERGRYRRCDLGFVRQSPDLVPGVRAIDNACLKLFADLTHKQAHRQILPMLERLGREHRLQHTPEQLSLGERQRLMIARALSTGPKLVLADEPTGSLDSSRGRETLGLLSEICREREVGMLLVTHDPQAAGVADRVLGLHDGRLVEHEPTGPPIPPTEDWERVP